VNIAVSTRRALIRKSTAWSRLVRAALVWLGEADPLATADTIRASDPVLDQLRQVLSAWHSVIGLERVTVKDVIKLVTEQHESTLREALLTVAGSGGAVNSRKLGNWLARHKNRIVDGLSIQPGPMRDGIGQWALFSVRFSGSSGSQWVSPNATRESVSDSFGNRAVGNPLKPTDPLNGESPDDDLNSLAREFWH
jgi:hypothetical protein